MEIGMANATLKEQLLEASKEKAKKMILEIFEEKAQVVRPISPLDKDFEWAFG